MYRLTHRDQKEMAAAGSVRDPNWTEGDNEKPAPSNAELSVAASKNMTLLRKISVDYGYRHTSAVAQATAQSGKAMANGFTQANSTLACPREEAWRQRFLTTEIYRLIIEKLLPRKWVMLSLISEMGFIRPDRLTKVGPKGGTATCKAVQQKLIDVLADHGVKFAIGSLDIAFCVDVREVGKLGFEGVNFRDHWLAHMTVMIPEKAFNRIEAALREAYPATDLVPKPIKAEPWDGDPKAIAYLFKRLANKSAGTRRETYVKVSERREKPRQNTRKGKLRASEHRDLIVLLDQLAPDCRYLLLGMRPHEDSSGLTIIIDG